MLSVIPAGLEPATYGLGKPLDHDVSQSDVNPSNDLRQGASPNGVVRCGYPQPGCSTVAKQQIIAAVLTELRDQWATAGDANVLRRRLLELLLYLDSP
jgi:hypothetical protein